MPAPAPSKTYTTKILREGQATGLPVPFDPVPVFGKVRAPVKVTLNGYTYRSTIAAMGGMTFLPLAKIHRDAAGLTGDETLPVTLTLDTEERVVEPPADLAKALKQAGAWQQWTEMSFTHQREWASAVEEAKKPETRTRRIDSAVAEIGARKVKAATANAATAKTTTAKTTTANKTTAKKATAKKATAKKATAKKATAKKATAKKATNNATGSTRKKVR